MPLGLRLKKIIDILEPHPMFWDVCCDHGYLGRQVLLKGLAQEVHFVDCAAEIIQKLEESYRPHFKKLGRRKLFFHSKRAEDLDWSKIAGNVSVVGIGGENLIAILRQIPSLFFQKGTLFLCAHSKSELLKDYLDGYQEIYFKDEGEALSMEVHPVTENGRERLIYKLTRVKKVKF